MRPPLPPPRPPSAAPSPGRQLIGAFSACSNVTGLLTDVPAVARIMHRAGGLAVFDYSASAPYVRIDVSGAGDPEARLDAVYYSPHKFIGGPGGCGVLLFHDGLYRRDLPPSLPGGGTVSFVTQQSADFEEDVEVLCLLTSATLDPVS